MTQTTLWKKRLGVMGLSLVLALSCAPVAFAAEDIIVPDAPDTLVSNNDEGIDELPRGFFDETSTNEVAPGISDNFESLANEATLDEEVIAEGSGENGVGAENAADISWKLTKGGILSFEGSGAIKKYSTTGAPWYQHVVANFKETGIEIIIGEGIISLPVAFYFNNPSKTAFVKNLKLPSTLVSISSATFAGAKILEFSGSSPLCDGNFIYEDTSKTTIYKAKASLTRVSIPPGVERLSSNSFSNMNIDYLYLPASLKLLDGAFPSSNESAGTSVYGVDIDPGNTHFYVNQDITAVSFGRVMPTSGADKGTGEIRVVIMKKTDDRGVVYSNDGRILYEAPKDIAGAYRVPDGCLVISINAFAACTELTSVVIPDGVTFIGYGAFRDCSKLASLSLPDSVTSIGNVAFANTALVSFRAPANLWKEQAGDKTLDSFSKDSAMVSGSGSLFVDENSSASILGRPGFNWKMSGISHIDLSAYGREYLAPYMFMGLDQLTEVSIPVNVRILDAGVFFGCSSLKDVYCYNPSVSVAGAGTTGDPSLGWTSDTYPTFSAQFEDGDTWKARSMEGLNFFGLAYASNSLIEYAQTNNCNFIPFVVFDNANSESLFGYQVTGYNEVSVADLAYTGEALTPEVRVVFTDRDGVADRVLKDGQACNITYQDSSGKVVSSIVEPGTYTAQIAGDEKSVFGTQSVSFQVSASGEAGKPDSGTVLAGGGLNVLPNTGDGIVGASCALLVTSTLGSLACAGVALRRRQRQ